MSKEPESYKEHVDRLETGLASYAKTSFEPFSQTFVDGGSILDYYQKQWRDKQAERLKNRTPLQIERDRILYSWPMRKQTEKYHVLYNGQRRIVRNYTTHTMRMAQVTRSICRGLCLNSDFAEAIALGSKVGAAPFIHAAKDPIADWVKARVHEVDEMYLKANPRKRSVEQQFSIDFGDLAIPQWVAQVESPDVLEKVQRYIPWAAGRGVEKPYTSGQQSYWVLCTNPFTMEPRSHVYFPETMVGIWRHTRGLKPEKNSFHHRCQLREATNSLLELKWNQFTYEALVVQYADDITWVIENLNDANSAALLNRRDSIYTEALKHLGEDVPEGLWRPLHNNDSGGIYTYFINDFVSRSLEVLTALGDGAAGRAALREGEPNSAIGLSYDAETQLDRLKKFLEDVVFEEYRVRNRTKMLKTISLACMDLLYQGEDAMTKMINEKASLERWSYEGSERAKAMVTDPVHRIQLAVDIFSDMGDQEIYDFVGIQSL